MENILFINACVRERSRTLSLAQYILDKLNGEICEINLEQENLKPLDGNMLEKRERLAAEKNFSDEMFRYAEEFAVADTIVIAAPFWDLSFPSLLKIYFEAVTVCGITFCYENNAPVGLCRANRLFYITTAGGPIISDFGFSYVKELAETFYGIKQTKCFRAEGLDIIGADVDGIMAKAKSEIEVWLALNSHNRPTKET